MPATLAFYALAGSGALYSLLCLVRLFRAYERTRDELGDRRNGR